MNPTFITACPVEVSPLARRNDNDPHVTDHFQKQIDEKEAAGDAEAMSPTAGEGIGIDCLVMLYPVPPSIKDILLFP